MNVNVLYNPTTFNRISSYNSEAAKNVKTYFPKVGVKADSIKSDLASRDWKDINVLNQLFSWWNINMYVLHCWIYNNWITVAYIISNSQMHPFWHIAPANMLHGYRLLDCLCSLNRNLYISGSAITSLGRRLDNIKLHRTNQYTWNQKGCIYHYLNHCYVYLALQQGM